ncbi:MAG: alternative ribosome rescue aminoacyl-tRNA hydrolase ArfB [Pseudomonadota bacterium]
MASKDIQLTRGRIIPGWSLTEVYKHSGGPGGQNVNKVETGVQLRFAYKSVSLFTERQKRSLENLGGSRVTKDGEIIIDATRFRTQDKNREDARRRLGELVEEALAPPPPPRRKTKPSRGAIERRLRAKSSRANIKKARSRPPVE